LRKYSKDYDKAQANDSEITFDASSVRRYDDNGFLHIDTSPLTKEQVVHYLGIEIPNWHERGLDPTKEYFGYRPAKEIEKAAKTFNGLPVMLNHHVVTPDAPSKDYQVGHTGTNAKYNAPYLENAIIITDKDGIDRINDGTFRQISAGYRFDPDFTPGVFNGQPYDFVMRNLRGNHIALVNKGRAGKDVMVHDAEPTEFKTDVDSDTAGLKNVAANYVAKDVNQQTGVNMNDNEKVQKLLAMVAKYLPEEVMDEIEEKAEALIADAEEVKDEVEKDEDFNDEEEIVKAEEDKEAKDDELDEEAVKDNESFDRKEKGLKDEMVANDLDSTNPEIVKAFLAGKSDKHAMDSSDLIDRITRKSMAEISKRNQLAESVSKHIGAFAFDSMTAKDVAIYAAKKLGLNVSQDQALTAVEAYLFNRETPKAMAMDSAIKGRKNQVTDFYKLD